MKKILPLLASLIIVVFIFLIANREIINSIEWQATEFVLGFIVGTLFNVFIGGIINFFSSKGKKKRTNYDGDWERPPKRRPFWSPLLTSIIHIASYLFSKFFCYSFYFTQFFYTCFFYFFYATKCFK